MEATKEPELGHLRARIRRWDDGRWGWRVREWSVNWFNHDMLSGEEPKPTWWTAWHPKHATKGNTRTENGARRKACRSLDRIIKARALETPWQDIECAP